MLGLSWLSPTILGAIGIAILATAAGWFLAHRLDSIPYNALLASKASLQAEYSDYKQAVAAAADKATADALAKQSQLQAKNDALQAQLAQTQRTANAQSQKLKDLLASARPGDSRALGPSDMTGLCCCAGAGERLPGSSRLWQSTLRWLT